MPKVVSIHKVRKRKDAGAASMPRYMDGFEPCSQDMTICGDCEGNREKMKCPRLRQWLSEREGE